MTLPGIPIIVAFLGILSNTNDWAPTLEFFPMVILPKIVALQPIKTLSSIVGCLFLY